MKALAAGIRCRIRPGATTYSGRTRSTRRPCQQTCSGAVGAAASRSRCRAYYDALAAAQPDAGQARRLRPVAQRARTSSPTASPPAPNTQRRRLQAGRDGARARSTPASGSRPRSCGASSSTSSSTPATPRRASRRCLASTEVWFIPVFNLDGYDYTFQTRGSRLWRKNLRDTNGNGTIGSGDGVDTNRNFAEQWGYDNEGSSATPSNETYRGAAPESEPEVSSFHALMKRIKPRVLHRLPLLREPRPVSAGLAGGDPRRRQPADGGAGRHGPQSVGGGLRPGRRR